MSVKSFHDYLVYSNGTIYSNKTEKFLKLDCYGSYAKVTLWIEGQPKRFSAENNRRAREKGLNASGCFAGRKNPRYRFEIHGENGRMYMMSELTALTGKSLTWVYNHIVKFLNCEDVAEFKRCGIISIVDLKGKVNRLSKADRQVE